MLFTIFKGNIPTCPDQEPVVHLVTTIQAVQAAGLPFVFTDGHGIMRLTSFFEDLAQLDHVDWTIMRTHYCWSDTPTDNDRRRRRQAEFLIHDFMPWSLINEIGVMNSKVKTVVEQMLLRSSHKPIVNVRRLWYYGA